MQRHRSAERALFCRAGLTLIIGLAASAVLLSVLLQARGYNPVPYHDQWSSVGLADRYLRNALSLGDLFAAHNEHRIVLPRLVFLADIAWDQARNRINLIATALVQLLVFLLFLRQWLTLPAPGARWMGVLATAVLLSGAVQYENFTWGFQVQFCGVFALALLTALLAARACAPDRTGWGGLAGCLLAGAAAALTMANGALALLCAAFALQVSRRTVWMPLLAIAAAGLATLAIYAVAYTPVPGHSPAGFALAHPHRLGLYLLAFLGSWWAPLGLAAAVGLGAIGLAGYAFIGLLALRGRLRENSLVVGLFGFMTFVVASGLVTGLGRLSFGLEQAISSRYATPSALFWASLILAVAKIAASRPGSTADRATPFLRGTLALVAVLTAGVSHLGHIGASLSIQDLSRRFETGAAALRTGVFDPAALNALLPDPAAVWQFAAILRGHGLSIFADLPGGGVGRGVTGTGLHLEGTCPALELRAARAPESTQPSFRISGSMRRRWSLQRPDLLFISKDDRIVGYGATVPGRWPGSAGRILVGYAVTAEPTLKVYARRSDGTRLCFVGEVALDQTTVLPSRVSPWPNEEVSLLTVEDVSLQGSFSPDGHDPVAGRPARTAKLYGSFAGDDRNRGRLIFKGVVPSSSVLRMAVSTGPSTVSQRFEVRSSSDGSLVGLVILPVTRSWSLLTVNIPETHRGVPLDVHVIDDGSGWGEWVAVGRPIQ